MKKLKSMLFLVIPIVILMSSCATPVAETLVPPTETSYPSETWTPTSTEIPEIPTPTATSTPTETPTVTPTKVPVYTELGEQLNWVVEMLGWEIVLCDADVVKEDLDRGIFLYREDTHEYFCDLKGHIPEPVSVPKFSDGEKQYLLEFGEIFGFSYMDPDNDPDGFHFFLEVSHSTYYPSPSTYSADELISMYYTAKSLEEIRTWNSYMAPIRAWPITYEEFVALADPYEGLDIGLTR